jgi:transcription initiation factor TFIIIB Brf1 subunit/transcription initiation factor TFIIB
MNFDQDTLNLFKNTSKPSIWDNNVQNTKNKVLSISNISDDHFIKCDDCGCSNSVVHDISNSNVLCTNCGIAINEIVNFKNNNNLVSINMDNDKNNLSGIMNPYYPKSSLSSTMYVDYKSKNKSSLYNLIKIHKWNSGTYYEKKLWLNLKKIKNICKLHNLSQVIIDDASSRLKDIYDIEYTSGKKKGKKIITRGNSSERISAASVLESCNYYNEPRTNIEIAKYFGLDKASDVNKGIKKRRKFLKMNKKNKIKYKSQNIDGYIKLFCKKMRFNTCIQIIIKETIKNIQLYNIAINKKHISVVAGTIYIICVVIEKLNFISIKDISIACNNTCEATIDDIYKILFINRYKILPSRERMLELIKEYNNESLFDCKPQTFKI